MTVDCYYTPESAPCRAVIMAAATIGVDLNLIVVNTQANEHLKHEFLSKNPQHCLPTIDDNDVVIWYAGPIMVYLSDFYGKSDDLYPKAPRKRAMVDQKLHFDHDIIYKSFTEEYYPRLAYPGKRKKQNSSSLFEINMGFHGLDRMLARSEFVAGDDFSLADISLAATLSSYEAVGFDFSCYNNVARWYSIVPPTIPGWSNNITGANILKEKFKAVRNVD